MKLVLQRSVRKLKEPAVFWSAMTDALSKPLPYRPLRERCPRRKSTACNAWKSKQAGDVLKEVRAAVSARFEAFNKDGQRALCAAC